MKKRHIYYFLAGLVATFAVAYTLLLYRFSESRQDRSGISTFEQCADAGNLIMESYPRQCRTPDGRSFVEKIDISTPYLFGFADFAVERVRKDAPAPVDFDSLPQARTFRTRISQAAASGPNFAGRYTVAEWGCGTSCQNYAIVDSVTGRIVEYGLGSEHGAEFYATSTLLVLNPPRSVNEVSGLQPNLLIQYFEMRGGRLIHLASQKPGEKDAAMCIQVITTARNPLTGEVKEFPTPCAVPGGWDVMAGS